jgi:hypothetical protein
MDKFVVRKLSHSECIVRLKFKVLSPKLKQKVRSPWSTMRLIDQLKDILDLVQRDLGSVELTNDQTTRSDVFLFISNNRAVGCALVEPISIAYRRDARSCADTEVTTL